MVMNCIRRIDQISDTGMVFVLREYEGKQILVETHS